MSFSKEVAFARNLGFINEAEQDRLHNSVVAIAGAGGDGGMLAVQLARLGVGEIRLADPDPFEIENINRQEVCTTKTVGINKAVAVADHLREINPDIKTPLFTEGVTPENVQEFMAGADLVIDETEFTMHELGVMIAREAREQNIPNLMALNIGFGATVTTYAPDGKSFERIMGLPENAPLDEIAEMDVPLSRWLPYLPKYGDIDVLSKVAKGEKSAPSIAPGVAMAAGVGSSQALLNLLHPQNNRKKPVRAPRAIIIDAMSLEAKVVTANQLTHYKHLGSMVMRNALGLVPKASY
jgi:tRNA threonylcarbamoyladenosine dehydratase